ncbi:hypothetical protein [Thermophilibacter mediterraneus]|uniref:hypothetical protein n=1 Tax=Thermophilibacter mediterraneus TaxID=1871031 RepID=UPI00093017D8|nr:hypothetical protein [Thermophilibacter mediterraneus]
MEDGSVISDLEPSIPRTPAQAVLRIVSILMGVIGAVALVGGVIVLAANVMGRLPGGDIWTVATFGVMIVVASGLLLLTAVLGIMASNNSARVEPYRFLCYLVGLAVLVAIVWGWGMGTFILFNPIVLTTTIVYVLVCSRLADKVKEEHDKGVKGETFLRSRHQRVLHLLSDIIILKGVITLVVVIVLGAALVVYGEGERAVISGVPVTVSGQVFALLVTGGLASGLNVLAGCLGIRGANRPQKVVPFLVIAALSVAMDLVQVVSALIGRGVMDVAFDVLLDLLFMGSCLYLAVRVMRQPTPEELAAAAGVALVPDDEA